LSSKGHISKEIPPDIAATQYLGFTMMRPWESALSSLNPKYWVAGCQANRYGLEKIGMTEYFIHTGKSLCPLSPLRRGFLRPHTLHEESYSSVSVFGKRS
jgi:hypothetical protein